MLPAKSRYYKILSEYFNAQNYFFESLINQKIRAKTKPPSSRPVNTRKVIELPWQLLKKICLSEDWEEVEILFLDLQFIEAKAEAGLVFDLANNFLQAIIAMPTSRPYLQILRLFEEAVRRDIYFISDHPTTLFQCLWNSCWWYDCFEAANHYPIQENKGCQDELPWNQSKPKLHKLLDEWRKNKQLSGLTVPWMRALRPPPIPLNYGMGMILPLGSEKQLTFQSRDLFEFGLSFKRTYLYFVNNNKFLCTLIYKGGKLIECSHLWDLTTGIELDKPDLFYFRLKENQNNKNEQLERSKIGDTIDGYISLIYSKHKGQHSVIPLGKNQECYIGEFSPSGNVFAYGLQEFDLPYILGIWCLKTRRKLLEIESRLVQITALAFSNNGDWLAVGYKNGSVQIINTNTGCVIYSFNTDGSGIYAIAVTDDIKHCSIGNNGFVRLFRLPIKSYNNNFVSHGFTDWPWCHKDEMHFTPNGLHLVTRIYDKVFLWNTENGQCTELRKHFDNYVNDGFFGGGPPLGIYCTDEKIILVDSEHTCIWRVIDGSFIQGFESEVGSYRDIIFTESGNYYLKWKHTDSQELIKKVIYNTINDEVIQILLPNINILAAISRPGKDSFICAHADTIIRMWEVTNKEPVLSIKTNFTEFVNLACTYDGKLVIARSNRGNIGVWELDTGNLVRYWDNSVSSNSKTSNEKLVSELIVSPINYLFVLLQPDGLFEVYNINSGEYFQYPGNDDSILKAFIASIWYKVKNKNNTEIHNLSESSACCWLPIHGFTQWSADGEKWCLAKDGQVYLYALEDFNQ